MPLLFPYPLVYKLNIALTTTAGDIALITNPNMHAIKNSSDYGISVS